VTAKLLEENSIALNGMRKEKKNKKGSLTDQGDMEEDGYEEKGFKRKGPREGNNPILTIRR